MNLNTKTSGTFLAVSVGPGEGSLLTLKALRAILESPVLAVPHSRKGEPLALQIAKEGLREYESLVKGRPQSSEEAEAFWQSKTLLPLTLPMTKDQEVLDRAHEAAAKAVAEVLDRGEDVAMLNLGDVSIYSTAGYLADRLKEQGYPVTYVSGVPSFCASAGALGMSLTTMASPIVVLPGAAEEEVVHRLLDEVGTKILMKTRKGMPETIELLKAKGLSEDVRVAVNCGLPGERLYETLSDYAKDLQEHPEEVGSYYTTLLVTPGEEC